MKTQHIYFSRFFIGIIFMLLSSTLVFSQVPKLPDGAQTIWIVEGPKEIIAHITFDPKTVADKLPDSLQFITLEDLANRGSKVAEAYLNANPERNFWGVSFIEIVRQEKFQIDDNELNLGNDEGIGVWIAGVRPANQKSKFKPGRLTLELWVPDSSYVTYMREKGHYATYGEVVLKEDPHGIWTGSIISEGLHISASCSPTGEEKKLNSAINIVYPPATFNFPGYLRVAYAGHKEKQCGDFSNWDFEGTHPISQVEIIGSMVFQYGFDLLGGVYSFD